jgi:hypothetical protein
MGHISANILDGAPLPVKPSATCRRSPWYNFVQADFQKKAQAICSHRSALDGAGLLMNFD